MTYSFTVSVVVPVYNSETCIAETIESLGRQTLAPCEIILVDDGSTDRSQEIIAQFGARVRYVYQANRGPAAARNHGVTLASGDFIAFTDSDCQPAPDWLLRFSESFTAPQVAGVGGIVRSADSGLLAEYVDFVRLLDPLEDETGSIPYLITANACFRRAVLLEAGLFSERFKKPGGEEPELCLKIRERGYVFHRNEAALVLHHHRETLAAFVKTLANYGEGRYVLAQTYPAYRQAQALKVWLRQMVALRSCLTRWRAYRERLDVKRAAFFALMDYARNAALAYGYWRGERNAA